MTSLYDKIYHIGLVRGGVALRRTVAMFHRSVELRKGAVELD
jgi:hypothetical protein